METSLLPKLDIDHNNICGLYKKTESTSILTPIKHRTTIVKYTKLPDYESDIKVSWPQQKYSRLCLFTTLNDDEMRTIRSLKSDILFPKKMTSDLPKRKIVTITEDDENDLHPRFSRESKRSSSVKTSNRSVATDYKEKKMMSTRNTSRFSMSSKYANETKARTKINSTQITSEINVNNRKYSNMSNEQLDHGQYKNNKDNGKEGVSRNLKNSNISKTFVSKDIVSRKKEREISSIKTRLLKDVSSNISTKKPIEKSRTDNSSAHTINSKVTLLNEIQTKNKPVAVIHVPLEEKYQKMYVNSKEDENLIKQNSTCNVYEVKNYKNVNIGTEPSPITVDQVTNMDDFGINAVKNDSKNIYVQTEMTKETFDGLKIPNVSLIKDKSGSKEKECKIDYISLPNNTQIPSVTMSSAENDNDKIGLSFCTSYIINQATLTYTTQQKNNSHLVESKDITPTIQTPSPLYYPVNVVSVYKNEVKRNDDSKEGATNNNIISKCNEIEMDNTKSINEVKSVNCCYGLNTSKLVKPSDIIRTIEVNTGSLQSEYLCDQFQRELNFIDSFFESLQYLENSSLSAKCFVNEKVDNLVYSPELFKNVFNDEDSNYDSFFTKLDNDVNIDDTETMTSKSLCLLNSLIRDEQRRAKNLLFVLKMREDALKEFATSQILWLENKKKHDNTDVSVLKKKQRGALLKLQHECGEMQRMRKALLTLSEKRKVAFMKTKKSLELKLKNNIDVDQIVKKKLKKSMCVDRNTAPLKCFDLSSSGCEESSTSKYNSESALLDAGNACVAARRVRSAEKSIQTGNSVTLADESTETAAENFVVVDGGYLNILFHNLSLPQIFSSGKQYEVKEEALKTIVDSSITHHDNISKEDIVEKLIDHSKNHDNDESSSPSTARSLVEEFDQYYKDLEEEKILADSSHQDLTSPGVVYELKDSSVQVSQCTNEQCENRLYQSASTMTSDSTDNIASSNNLFSTEQSCLCDALDLANSLTMEDFALLNQSGPLPVPVGAAAQTDISGADVTATPTSKSAYTSTMSESNDDSGSVCQSVSSIPSLDSPVHSEAEELRRQQLAIEREIKALEQEQCQLLVVREIPDKPPPPYTPPADSRAPKPSPVFHMGENTEEKIKNLIVDPLNAALDTHDTFNVFLKDFCQESLERHKLQNSDEPWDACNLLPQKRQYDTEKLVQRTSSELSEVLDGATPTLVSAVVGARRSDHIDDILFSEWRRCEPEWTSLHTDEAIVKNQIFDCIFQKILTETVDEYKKIVKSNNTTE